MPDRFEAEKKERVAEACRLLAGDPDGEMPCAFAQAFFAHGAAEDLVQYSAQELAEIARAAFVFFRSRDAPTEIRLRDVARSDGSGRVLTAIEILTSNRPFILDSLLGELQASGKAVKLVLHPILEAVRDGAGALTRLAGRHGKTAAAGVLRESFVHIQVPQIADPADREALHRDLTTLMAEIHVVTDDWGAMRERLRAAIAELQGAPEGRRDEETVAFVQWIEDHNFVLLGVREFSYRNLDEQALEGAEGEGLGLLRDPGFKVLRRGGELVTMTPEIREFLLNPEPLIVTKANVRSRVHRRDYLDYIGIKIFDEGSQVTGELRVIGLFTTAAFNRSVQEIPMIRRKVANIVARAGFDPLSHSGKSLVQILERYPRTELFQAEEDVLYDSALAILQLGERPRIRALARRDRFDRFVSVLVFVPRDRYSSDLRERLGQALSELYDGHVSAFFPDLSGLALARVQFIIGRNRGVGPDPSQSEVEARIRALVRTWEDELTEVLAEAWPADEARRLLRRYGGAFGSDYQAAFPAAVAASDIRVMEGLDRDNPIAAAFGRRTEAVDSQVTLRFHHLGAPIPLSRRVPLLENLGFLVINERTDRVRPGSGDLVYIHDMMLSVRGKAEIDIGGSGERLRDAVLAIWRGAAENDGFNGLVLAAGLDWRQAAVLRTIGRYMRQTAVPFSIDYLWGALLRHPEIAAQLMARFVARFDPALSKRQEAEERADKALEGALEGVASLDDDTILRGYLRVIRAAVRTDFFARDEAGRPPAGVTLKIRPGDLPFVPEPRPFREIFVLKPDVEGLHMRFGPVARGGLRWSDRPQDYRLEVLGLVKAQQVKNAVIVPVGAKGGFVPLKLPEGGSREEIFEAGRQAYIGFVERLLSVTDDLDGETVVPPAGIVRHDPDDPYLVVAADKGTATFSDTANAIATAKGYWLGDAFASGGSAGYDHKVMGITARGAWEAVKRHFREINVDVQREPFTVAGVGDMSGDVFGNGMLLSGAIRLVAACDHRDIFVDPDPEPTRSLDERGRLFALPRSSWRDYDRALISAGGGVFSRSEKQIPVSPEMRRALSFDKDAARPAELMSAILKAPVDLLWFGGIGTYVRGPEESDADVGDKANDAIRVSAAELAAKVVGEGANLGMTQKARIAYSARGGRCNSDAIDNSGGVNSSDVEVNIKIALAPAVRAGKLDLEARNDLLKRMTPEVAQLVLRNNYIQTLAISLEERRGLDNLPNQIRLIRELESGGLLDREVESLPDDQRLAERAAAGHRLTRPEIGTLLAFAKIALFNDLVASEVPDDPYLARELFRYFPVAMQEGFAAEINAHRLRREIIATQLSNSLVNRGGPTLVLSLRDQGGASARDAARAFAAVRDSFAMQDIHGRIDALDGVIAGPLQLELYGTVQDVLVDRMGWFIRNVNLGTGLAGIVAHYSDCLVALGGRLPGLLAAPAAKAVRAAETRLKAAKVPEDVASRLALLPALARATDVILIADETGHALEAAAAGFFAIGARFHFAEVEAMLAQVEARDYYEGLAVQKARHAIEAAQRDLARSLLTAPAGAEDLQAWEVSSGKRVGEVAGKVTAILADGAATSAKGTVAASLLAELARQLR